MLLPPTTDKTLTQEGVPADAKTVGAALTELADMIADNAARLDEQEAALVDVAAVAAGKE